MSAFRDPPSAPRGSTRRSGQSNVEVAIDEGREASPMMTSNPASTAARSDFAPYSGEALLDPWPGYRELRGAGPAVWLPQYETFALMRYAAVRRALGTGSPSSAATA
jgi:cytochrome P450